MSRGEPPVGVWFFVAYRAMESEIMESMRAAGYDDVTLAQARILARVADDGIRLTELADRALVTKQTAQVLVTELERHGYVERVPDPSDARARLILLARRGRRAHTEAARIERRIEAGWERHLGTGDMADLRRIMLRLREITDPFA